MTDDGPSKERLADRLRDIADRIEDGEYAPTGVELAKPSHKEDAQGRVTVRFVTVDMLRRWKADYEEWSDAE